jgi:hypothetical protein
MPLVEEEVVPPILAVLQENKTKYNKLIQYAKLLYVYKVKVLAKCFCQECVNFRSKKKWYDPEIEFQSLK